MRRMILTLAEWDENGNMLDLVPWISTMCWTWMTECPVKQRPRTFPSTAPTSAVNEARRETNIR